MKLRAKTTFLFVATSLIIVAVGFFLLYTQNKFSSVTTHLRNINTLNHQVDILSGATFTYLRNPGDQSFLAFENAIDFTQQHINSTVQLSRQETVPTYYDTEELTTLLLQDVQNLHKTISTFHDFYSHQSVITPLEASLINELDGPFAETPEDASGLEYVELAQAYNALLATSEKTDTISDITKNTNHQAQVTFQSITRRITSVTQEGSEIILSAQRTMTLAIGIGLSLTLFFVLLLLISFYVPLSGSLILLDRDIEDIIDKRIKGKVHSRLLDRHDEVGEIAQGIRVLALEKREPAKKKTARKKVSKKTSPKKETTKKKTPTKKATEKKKTSAKRKSVKKDTIAKKPAAKKTKTAAKKPTKKK